VALSPPGSIGGQLLLSRGGAPKLGVVYLEGVPAGSWSLPRERALLALRGAQFLPELLVVPVGQTVQIANQDRLNHSPFSLSTARPFEVGRQPPGESHTITFDRPGVIDLFCNIHETMQGVILVVPSTFYALPTEGGNFQLASVPAGHYRLVGYSPEVGQAEQVVLPVEVRPRERTTVRLLLGQPAAAREKRK
jgi:hypothetical protein